MRKLILVFFLSLIVYANINAQQKDFENQLFVGASGGAIISSIDFVPNVFQEINLGMTAGFSAKYISQKNLGMILEINFAQRGWKEEFPKSSNLAYSRTMNYLEIPIMTHIYLGNKTRFIINLGPQVSFLLGEKVKANTDFINLNPQGTQYKKIEHRFDYGLIGGLGMELNTPIGSFDLEGRYYFGLGDIFDNKRETDIQKFSRSAHRVIEAKLSYYFKL